MWLDPQLKDKGTDASHTRPTDFVNSRPPTTINTRLGRSDTRARIIHCRNSEQRAGFKRACGWLAGWFRFAYSGSFGWFRWLRYAYLVGSAGRRTRTGTGGMIYLSGCHRGPVSGPADGLTDGPTTVKKGEVRRRQTGNELRGGCGHCLSLLPLVSCERNDGAARRVAARQLELPIA